MEALLGKAEERKSGKSSASRPKGYWAAFGACVLLVSSAQLLHESASWSLDYGTVLGTFINLRAQSCNAHAAGLIDRPEPISAAELISLFDVAKLPKEDIPLRWEA